MTVVFALSVTLHVWVLAVVHPDQDENELLPEVAGAVSVTDVPALYVLAKLVDPLEALLLSAGDTVIATPDEGADELMVRV